MDLLPANASPLKIYSQAKRILRTTSRASEPDWYRQAHELNLQWHLWIGSRTGISAIYSKSLGQWFEGPDLPPINFEIDESGVNRGPDAPSRAALNEVIKKMVSTREFGGRTKSLGVVIHLADGLRVRELAPDFAEDDDFDNLNELLGTAPDIALGDDTVDNREGRWRLLPLLGITEGPRRSLAVQVSSKFENIAKALADYGELNNFPVVVNVRSAALEAIPALAYAEPSIQSIGEGATLALVVFEPMTLLFAMGNRGELQMVRPLLHRGAPHLGPTEVYEAITQTAALLNQRDPRVVLASAVGLGEELLGSLLEIYREQHPGARVRIVEATSLELVSGVPGGRLELAAAVHEGAPVEGEAPFHKELREKWARQDFYGPTKDQVAMMPTRGDLRLLKFGALAQKVAVAAILVYSGWAGMDFVRKMSSGAWKVSPDDAQNMELELAKLQKERREWQHWDRLLKKRSEGWLAMEALLELFPAEGGVILKDASYRSEADDSARDSDHIGIRRFWDISGYANPELAASLPTLGSRTRVAEMLNGIAERNFAPYLSVGAQTREVQVTLQQKQGSMPPSLEFPAKVARHFRTSFELSIVQSLSAKDDLAINTVPLKSE
jgi:hypothetical protein